MIGIVTLEGQSKAWAEPLAEEIAKYEPNLPVATVVAKPGEGSYAACINQLAERWVRDYDTPFFIPLNDDVSCAGTFWASVKRLPPDVLYGMTANRGGKKTWLDGWIYFISREIWDTVGPFDENFAIAGFEDADYTWRALSHGYKFATVKAPFKHFKNSPRLKVPNFWEIRQQNMEYLKKKHNLPDDWSYR